MIPDHPILNAVRAEIDHADGTYGPPASTHESLGVLAEEWDELRDAVHGNDPVEIRHEAIQVAAVALRLAMACLEAEAGESAFAKRSFKWART
jgi:NTP pyrophosphatase (non-canonical NTP hydrolase)